MTISSSLKRSVAEAIVRKLQFHGFIAYFAGGCVRDQLRAIEPHDYDVATDAKPEQVEELFPNSDLVGKSFGVVIVRDSGVMVEVATFRKDAPYIDGRRPSGVTFVTAEEDAHRRDFTVNAIFYDPIKDEYHDFVNGRADLEQHLLRAVGNPYERFEEDKLRILRGVRFASTLDFEIEEQTWQAIVALTSKITIVSPERIREELNRWLTGPNPARGLDLLDQSGLLQLLLPEVAALKGVEQPPQFHPEGDVYVHTRLMLSHLHHASEILAWAILLHDIGKAPTQTRDQTGRIRFNGHETVGAQMSRKILARLRFSNAQIEQICVCVANHMSFKDVPQMRLSTLKKLMARETFPVETELHRIDCLSSHGQLEIYRLLQQKMEEFAKEGVRPTPFLRGEDVLSRGVKPGRFVGEVLREAYDLQLEGKFNNREEALNWLKQRLVSTPSSTSRNEIPYPPSTSDSSTKNRFLNHWLRSLGILITITVLLQFLDYTEPIRSLKGQMLDWLQKLPVDILSSATNFALIEVDSSTLTTHGNEKWPIPRLTYAITLQAIRPYHIRGVGFEMLMDEKNISLTSFDNTFASQVDRMQTTVFAATLLQTGEVNHLPLNFQPIATLQRDEWSHLIRYHSARVPLPSFSSHAILGFNNLVADTDGIVRSVPFVFRIGDRIYPSFLLQCLIAYEGLTIKDVELNSERWLILRKKNRIIHKIPIDEKGRMWIRWGHPIPNGKKIGLDLLVLASRQTMKENPSPVWNLAQLKDHFVFIGRQEPSTYQPVKTSWGYASPIQVHLAAWQTIFLNSFIRSLPWWCNGLITLIVAMLFWQLAYLKPVRWAWLGFGIITVDSLLFMVWAFWQFNLWFSPFTLLVCSIGGILLGARTHQSQFSAQNSVK